MSGTWTHLRSTAVREMGKLTLREDVWRLPGGGERTYPVLHVGMTVGVVPFVDAERVVLVRQFRHLARAESWELPGGGGQDGETPEAAAQRELREEGGYRAGRLTFLTRFYPVERVPGRGGVLLPGRGPRRRPPARGRRRVLRASHRALPRGGPMALDDRITESVSKVALLAAALRLGVRI